MFLPSITAYTQGSLLKFGRNASPDQTLMEKLWEPVKPSIAVFVRKTIARCILNLISLQIRKMKLTYMGSLLCFVLCIMSKYSLKDVCVSPLPPLRTISSDVPLNIDH